MQKLSAKKRKQLLSLAARPEIDFSDIPATRAIPPDAVIGKFYRPRKTSVTIRLDADVITWLKATGDGYQTRINNYLRRLMNEAPVSVQAMWADSQQHGTDKLAMREIDAIIAEVRAEQAAKHRPARKNANQRAQ
jgi:uncharacterized protein (DUF4415 family)